MNLNNVEKKDTTQNNNEKEVRLTKTFVDKVHPPTDKDQVFYRDEDLTGFALRITRKGSKSFIVEARVNGKPKRSTIGKYGRFTVEEARIEARKRLGKISLGIDPIVEKKERIAKQKTLATQTIRLQEVFHCYLDTKIDLKDETVKDYRRIFKETFIDWSNKPLREITEDLVAERHTERGKQSKARANNAMRVLRALFNFAKVKYKDSNNKSLFPENPVHILTKTKAWFRVKRRKNYIKFHQLGIWFEAVMNLDNEISRDYLLHILFSGLRASEGAKLEKSFIDLKARSFTIPETKNHEAHTLPISEFHCEIVAHQIKTSPNKYVFYGEGKKGHIVDVRGSIAKITEKTGIKFTLHDLRRTFITIAENLNLSGYTLKRLLNHKINNSDVTAGYIITDVERLRRPVQMILDYILGCAWLHYISTILWGFNTFNFIRESISNRNNQQIKNHFNISHASILEYTPQHISLTNCFNSEKISTFI